MGKLTISMVIFNSYVSLPEGNNIVYHSYKGYSISQLIGVYSNGVVWNRQNSIQELEQGPVFMREIWQISSATCLETCRAPDSLEHGIWITGLTWVWPSICHVYLYTWHSGLGPRYQVMVHSRLFKGFFNVFPQALYIEAHRLMFESVRIVHWCWLSSDSRDFATKICCWLWWTGS